MKNAQDMLKKYNFNCFIDLIVYHFLSFFLFRQIYNFNNIRGLFKNFNHHSSFSRKPIIKGH